MLKTEYFVGTLVNFNQNSFEASLKEAQQKKEAFISKNNNIARIESEDLVFASFTYNNGSVIPIIKLSYYEK